MRWKFLDPDRPEEASRRARGIAAIDEFWAGFAARRDAVEGGADRALAWVADHLRRIDEHLAWEMSPAAQGGRCMTITPESRRELRPLVATVLERAPHVPGWTFTGYRPPVAAEDLAGVVQSRVDADLAGWSVSPSAGEHHRVDLTYFAPAQVGPGSDRSHEIAFVATECLVGEERLDHWVGGIRVLPAGRRGHGAPLGELARHLDAAIEAIRDRLPAAPQESLAEDLSTWKMFELAPRPARDAPEQRDLRVAKSALPAMWRAAHGPGGFSSRRFSRCGETFCYVKVDSSGASDQDRLAGKAELEDALMDALDGGGGAFVGGGLGTIYSYVDLALRDLDRGVQIVRDALGRLAVPPRSWLQFFDADLAAEWVALHPDSPPPPMPAP